MLVCLFVAGIHGANVGPGGERQNWDGDQRQLLSSPPNHIHSHEKQHFSSVADITIQRSVK